MKPDRVIPIRLYIIPKENLFACSVSVVKVHKGRSCRRTPYRLASFKWRQLRPNKLKYLGFGFYKVAKEQKWATRPHESSVEKFQRTLKKLCKRSWSISMDLRITKLNQVTRGSINYFAIANMKNKMADADAHLRRMLRKVIWKQWKTPQKRAWGTSETWHR